MEKSALQCQRFATAAFQDVVSEYTEKQKQTEWRHHPLYLFAIICNVIHTFTWCVSAFIKEIMSISIRCQNSITNGCWCNLKWHIV